MFALSKKERVEIFAILCERIASPKQISDELGEGLSQVSYHVKVLRECCLIVEDHKVPRRGAVEHFYRAVRPTLIPPNAWDHLPPAIRKSISANILQHFFEDATASMEAGVPRELLVGPKPARAKESIRQPEALGMSRIETMSSASSRLPAERDHQLENALLTEIVSQHPDHLTQDELIVRMEDCPAGTDRIAILDALQELKRSGLIRFNGEVVEPTFAALRAAAIFECP